MNTKYLDEEIGKRGVSYGARFEEDRAAGNNCE
jgi:hypothetical protein